MEGKNWVYRLPAGAEKIHAMPEARLSQIDKGSASQVKEEKKDLRLEVESPSKTSSKDGALLSESRSRSHSQQSQPRLDTEKNASQKSKQAAPKEKRTKTNSQNAKGKGSLDAWLKAKPIVKDIIAVCCPYLSASIVTDIQDDV